MNKIAFLVPDMSMLNYAKYILAEDYGDIRVEFGMVTNGVQVAEELAAEGVEIIIARAATARAIRSSALTITVVEAPIIGFDIIQSVETARAHGNTIAVVAFSSMVVGIECLGPILGVTLRQYQLNRIEDTESAVLTAHQAGADVLLGGVVTARAAAKHGIPCVLLSMGKESILQAAREAKQIEQALQLDKMKRGLISTVLDYAYEGIITIDQGHSITSFNPAAQQLTKIDGAKAIGKKITAIWPDLKLENVLQSGQDDLHQIIAISGNRLICNKVPIVINGQPAGAVATFQEISQIQQMEAKIREQVYARGHVARFQFTDILGQSQAILDAVEAAKDFACTDSSILIMGESGTGKEIFAQSIHNYSKRAKGPFVAINCAALPGQILESELFGYVSGAFTGANREGKSGLFEVAHGGTIFLDEIGEMDYLNQGRLLRVLQEKTVRRLGSDRLIPVNVRIIAATNKNIHTLMLEKKFRDDLYYRLNVLSITLPSLRERKPDIRLYAETFFERYTAILKRKAALTEAAIKRLEKYHWPGNVRELQNFIERIVVTNKKSRIDVADVDALFKRSQSTAPMQIDQYELNSIQAALTQAKGKHTEAAKILGIDRSTLWRKLRRLGLT